ncbi:GDSL-type esterase/lipase family protein, partial [Ruminococcaceae bacterium OttesenSCG-928-D13]|nr:GDSL-type esterase/lipase family protein [Ruminococcaceae bacterium OttesenSCG-928-D13]
MKKRLFIILVALAIIALLLWLTLRLLWHFSVNIIPPIPAAVPGTIRVACVGDSTTYGMLLWRREKSNYPAKLGTLLGGDYSVRNFAANSTTVLTTGDHPYVSHKVFQLGCDFEPDVVLIMLGTNDAKPENWTGGEAFR